MDKWQPADTLYAASAFNAIEYSLVAKHMKTILAFFTGIISNGRY